MESPIKRISNEFKSKGVFSVDACERRNIIFYLMKNIFFSSAGLLVSNNFVQTYLIKEGLNSAQIGLIGFTGNIAYMMGFLFLFGIIDRQTDDTSVYAVSTLFYCITPLALPLFIFGDDIKNTQIYYVLLAAGVVQNLGVAFRVMLDNKILVRIIGIDIYGKLFGFDGIVNSIAGVLLSLLAIRLIAMLGFPAGFILLFALSLVMYALSAVTVLRYSLIFNARDKDSTDFLSPFSIIGNMFAKPEIRMLILPNILRGVAAGGVYYIMAVGIKRMDLPLIYSSYAVTASTLGIIAGNIFFGYAIDKLKSGKLCFIGSLLCASMLLGISVVNSKHLFIVLNFFIMLGQTQIDQGVPTGIYRNLPHNMLGSITGMRMLLMSLGMALSTLMIGYALNLTGAFFIMLVVGILQVFGGGLFWKAFKAGGKKIAILK